MLGTPSLHTAGGEEARDTNDFSIILCITLDNQYCVSTSTMYDVTSTPILL
jgi:hypothetical protein